MLFFSGREAFLDFNRAREAPHTRRPRRSVIVALVLSNSPWILSRHRRSSFARMFFLHPYAVGISHSAHFGAQVAPKISSLNPVFSATASQKSNFDMSKKLELMTLWRPAQVSNGSRRQILHHFNRHGWPENPAIAHPLIIFGSRISECICRISSGNCF